MWSSQVPETDTRGQPIEPKLWDIRTIIIIVNEQSMLHLFYFGLKVIYVLQGDGFVVSLVLVITTRDFYFETKTRPSLSCKVLESRPRLLHSRLESRASKHIPGLHTAIRPRDALLSDTVWH